ncbi:MAG: hypothetical protein PUD50_00420 [Eubacteriales bacterium]|nr:hypothetical protein [Eubacteriales bacterium]
MDDFMEQVARRKSQGFYSFLYYFSWIWVVLFGFIALISVSSIIMATESGGIRINWYALIQAVVLGGLAFLIWRRADYLRVEYDYTFTNGNLDVSRVLNNKRRKYLTALQMKDVIRCGPVGTQAFKKTLNEPGLKKHNFFVNRDANLTFFYFQKNGVKHMIVVELHPEMIDMIRSKSSYLGHGVWADENSERLYGSVS